MQAKSLSPSIRLIPQTQPQQGPLAAIVLWLSCCLLLSAPIHDLRAESPAASTPTANSVSFKRDVRPILSNHCFACHGPDEAHREADLRLDMASDVDPDMLIERILSTDEDIMMPPPSLNKPLDESQIETLQRWLEAGAPYEQHWAYIAPSASQPPQIDPQALSAASPTEGIDLSAWSEQSIDRWVLTSLQEKQLYPSPRADRRTLIRRLTLDLTGLPPTLAEIDDFLNDTSPDAYPKLVERLLNEPAYGENMARYWLDLVRFADTNGLHHDHYREITPYRDWVIRAFDDNLPFDDFITWQLAGDLLPSPTKDQLTASGFNRLHLIIDVGTALPEESFFRNVVDQVSAVGTAFMGLTMQCAVCHDHKYDPITQRDFYAMSAFFNNFDGEPETGGRGTEDFKRGLQVPYINLPSPEQTVALAAFDSEVGQLQAARTSLNERRQAAQVELEKLAAASTPAANATPSESSAGSPTEATVPAAPVESGNTESQVADSIAQIQQQVAQQTVTAFEQAIKQLDDLLKERQQQRLALIMEIPATLVMKERVEVRPAYIMTRGEYNQPGAEVQRNTPGFLPPLKAEGDVPTRLDLAHWFTDRNNPLTARVAVNRFWQQLFGVGLVKTSEDFGSQGETPRHPELLDYLTLQFIDSGWNVKELMRSIVLSETYQQTSRASRERYIADPRNRQLARGSRFRLDAEVVRDQVLAVSGLLNRELFGKSVKPPQPPGLWETVAMPSSYPNSYQPDSGDKTVRRSVYTFWKRAIPPPQMSIFDAPSRESCIARRERTNTPLQALLLMNEEQYFAAARQLASELLENNTTTDEARIAVAYETITAQQPDAHTVQELLQGLAAFGEHYGQDAAAVDAMLGNQPVSNQSEPPTASSKSRLAAWTMLVHSIMNLDITKTRE